MIGTMIGISESEFDFEVMNQTFSDINQAIALVLSLPIAVRIIILIVGFLALYGLASAVYSLGKLFLWLIYKAIVYTSLLIAFIVVLLFKVIYYNLEPGKRSENAVKETIALFRYIVEKEQEVWPFSELFKVEKKSEAEYRKAQEIQKKKAEEISKKEKSYLQAYSQKIEEQKQKIVGEQYFCSRCGAKFTPNMFKLLKSSNKCFCESCGQGFEVYQWL